MVSGTDGQQIDTEQLSISAYVTAHSYTITVEYLHMAEYTGLVIEMRRDGA